ncbi:hypothetical protein [Acinetobacter phage ABPH49]|nr:hypothetical protein [Acinetobacter phage ABPH49]
MIRRDRIVSDGGDNALHHMIRQVIALRLGDALAVHLAS